MHPILRNVEPLPNFEAHSLEVFTFCSGITTVSGAGKCPDDGVPFGRWIFGIQVGKPVDDEGEIRDVPLVQTKASDSLLGPQRPRCRIRFASLAASNCGSTSISVVRLIHALDAQQIWVLQFPVAASQSPNPGWASPTERWNQARSLGGSEWGPRLVRVNNLAFCVISCVPAATSLRAAIGDFEQFSPVQWVDRFCGFAGADAFGGFPALQKLLDSLFSCWSTGRTFCLQQRSEHHFTPSQFLAHFFATEWFARKQAVFVLLRHGPL